MKTFTIIGGVNGVGKTSFIGALKEMTTTLGTIIDTDRFTMEEGNASLSKESAILAEIQFCMNQGASFSLESSLSNLIPKKVLIQIIEAGYHIRLLYIALDTVEDSLSRIENRIRHGGYGASSYAVIHSFENRWNAVASILPYCDEAEFYDNNNGFIKIADYQNDKLQLAEAKPPKWSIELFSHCHSMNGSVDGILEFLPDANVCPRISPTEEFHPEMSPVKRPEST